MNIKKVDEKPMVIHTKERSKLHVKGVSEIKQKSRQRKEQESRAPIKQDNRMYEQYRKERPGKKTTAKKKSPVSGAVALAAAKTTLDEMEGGSEVYGAYRTAQFLAGPEINAARAGRNLYRSQAYKAKQQRIKKRQSGIQVKERGIRENAIKTAGRASGKTVKEKIKSTERTTTKKIARKTAKSTSKAIVTTAGTGAGGVLTGIAAGEVVGRVMEKRNVRNSTRNRMIKLFAAKLRQADHQESITKTLKDIVWMRFSIMAKHIARYIGTFLISLFAVVALVALPLIAIIAVIYNSPFAVFFPSISSGETIQEVLSAYVADFNSEVEGELSDYSGYDASEKIYVNFEGSGTPDNFCDVLMVYMIRHGDGDTATDMTDKAKQNLKAVFDDMCSYSIVSRVDVETDEEENTVTTKVKEIDVELKSCYDMIPVYGFDGEKQAVLAELMKPEYLAMLGYTGGGGDPGEGVTPEQYQAIVDSISGENGKKVLAFALSKVGYPYSQAYRDSGNYYDCSSFAYYAWRSAGVNLMYEGSNTASSEGKFCYDNNLLVEYDEMQPGDLIFYSYGKNGRFMDITHVAIYAGNGKVVEAANARLGVVYRTLQGRSAIVFIGRPR